MKTINFIEKFIGKFFNYENDVVILSRAFDPSSKDLNYITEVVGDISEMFKNMARLSDNGYVNNPKVDLSFLKPLFTGLDIVQKHLEGYSIVLNILFFNMVLLLMLKMVILLEKQCNLKTLQGEHCPDVISDIKTLRKGLLRMIHPGVKDKISMRGIKILLNSLVGYDSEYELKSSLDKLNTLLSVQLAGCTELVLKIPIVDGKPVTPDVVSKLSFNDGEGKLKTVCCKSMDGVIKDLRNILWSKDDLFIEQLTKIASCACINHRIIDGYLVCVFPQSEVRSSIQYVNEYTSRQLITDSEGLNDENHKKSLNTVIDMFNEINGKETSDKLLASLENNSNKRSTRITYRHMGGRLSISLKRQLTICLHESTADLSILKDFDQFKESLDIVGRYFVTLKQLAFDWCKSFVHFRDTSLLSPAGSKSLAALGDIHGPEFAKINVGSYISNMSKLLTDNKPLFEKYAIQDALITLKHACMMSDFYFTIGNLGVPHTLSNIGKKYVMWQWDLVNYKGYQPEGGIVITNLANVLIPKSARSVSIASFLPLYIAVYRGGRNECYMYGTDDIKRVWIDYDLTSCYTTVMSILGDPNYDKVSYLFNKTLDDMKAEDLLFNYIAVDVEFEFPVSVKYPCIPTRVDNDVDIYPRKGRSIITGPEYLAARSMGCRLFLKHGVIVPFKQNSKNSKKSSKYTGYFAPFKELVKDLQFKRRSYEKKTFYNYMYKEIGNSIYGQIAMGIGGKKTFDVKTKGYIRTDGNFISNSILAGYITGFTRALIGECMNNVQALNGKVLSCTTDGFITDITDLEEKILSLKSVQDDSLYYKDRFSCIDLYRDMRCYLTTFDNSKADSRALEVKHVEENGILSCKTRFQLGFTEKGILSCSGFQTRMLDRSFLIEEFAKVISTDRNKNLEFVQTGLRSAKDVFDKGGHLIATYKDRNFSLEYDNKRCIIPSEDGLLDSKPWLNVKEYGKIRSLKETITKPVFVKGFAPSGFKSYRSYIETCVRGFIKACLNNDADKRFGVPINYFKDYKGLIDFIYAHEPARIVKLTSSSISRLKNRNTISRTVPRTLENEAFISYVKENIVSFNSDLFFKELSSESLKTLKMLKNTSIVECLKPLNTDTRVNIKQVSWENTFTKNRSTLLNNFVQKRLYSTNNTPVRIVSKDCILLDPWFITGFIDTKGSFIVYVSSNEKRRVKLSFSISLPLEEKYILESIRLSLGGVGNIYVINKRRVNYRIESFSNLQTLVKHLDLYQLVTTKKFDYHCFKECLDIVNCNGHRTPEGLKNIDSIKLKLNKKNTDFNHVFDGIPNSQWVSGFISGDGTLKIETIASIDGKDQLNYAVCLHVRETEVVNGLIKFFNEQSLENSSLLQESHVNVIMTNFNGVLISDSMFTLVSFFKNHNVLGQLGSDIMKQLLTVEFFVNEIKRINDKSLKDVGYETSILIYLLFLIIIPVGFMAYLYDLATNEEDCVFDNTDVLDVCNSDDPNVRKHDTNVQLSGNVLEKVVSNSNSNTSIWHKLFGSNDSLKNITEKLPNKFISVDSVNSVNNVDSVDSVDSVNSIDNKKAEVFKEPISVFAAFTIERTFADDDGGLSDGCTVNERANEEFWEKANQKVVEKVSISGPFNSRVDYLSYINNVVLKDYSEEAKNVYWDMFVKNEEFSNVIVKSPIEAPTVLNTPVEGMDAMNVDSLRTYLKNSAGISEPSTPEKIPLLPEKIPLSINTDIGYSGTAVIERSSQRAEAAPSRISNLGLGFGLFKTESRTDLTLDLEDSKQTFKSTAELASNLTEWEKKVEHDERIRDEIKQTRMNEWKNRLFNEKFERYIAALNDEADKSPNSSNLKIKHKFFGHDACFEYFESLDYNARKAYLENLSEQELDIKKSRHYVEGVDYSPSESAKNRSALELYREAFKSHESANNPGIARAESANIPEILNNPESANKPEILNNPESLNTPATASRPESENASGSESVKSYEGKDEDKGKGKAVSRPES